MGKDLDIIKQIEKKFYIKFSNIWEKALGFAITDKLRGFAYLIGYFRQVMRPSYYYALDDDKNITALAILHTIKIKKNTEELFKIIIKLKSLNFLFLEQTELTQFPIQIKNMQNFLGNGMTL